MTQKLTISEARERLTQLPDDLQDREAAVILRRGKPVLAVLPWELYETILETLEVMSDPETVASLRRGIADIEAGRVYDLDETFEELGW